MEISVTYPSINPVGPTTPVRLGFHLNVANILENTTLRAEGNSIRPFLRAKGSMPMACASSHLRRAHGCQTTFAFHIAVRQGCDATQPRNLAKSVTEESDTSKHKAHLQLLARSQLEDRSGIILTNRAHPTSSCTYLLQRLTHLPSPTPARRSRLSPKDMKGAHWLCNVENRLPYLRCA